MNILSYDNRRLADILKKFDLHVNPQVVEIKHKKALTPDSWIVRLNINDKKYALYEEDHFEDMARITTEIEDAYDFTKVISFIRAADASDEEASEALAFTVTPIEDDHPFNIVALAELTKT